MALYAGEGRCSRVALGYEDMKKLVFLVLLLVAAGCAPPSR